MEKTAKKKTATITRDKIAAAYTDYVLTHGHRPGSVFQFAKQLKISEREFYSFYNSFQSLEASLWLSWFDETKTLIQQDKNYDVYSVREKVLSLFYTWLEKLKEARSFAIYQFEGMDRKDPNPRFMRKVQQAFEVFIDELTLEGIETQEIVERKRLVKHYKRAFWVQFVWVTQYWVRDESDEFQGTDALVEKSVNFAFEVIGKGVFDSFIDLTKFLIQNRSSII